MTEIAKIENNNPVSVDQQIENMIILFETNKVSIYHGVTLDHRLVADKNLKQKKIEEEEKLAKKLAELILQQFYNHPEKHNELEDLAVRMSGINDKTLQNPHYLKKLYECSQSKKYITNFDGVGTLQKTGATLMDVFISMNHKVTNPYAIKWAQYRVGLD